MVTALKVFADSSCQSLAVLSRELVSRPSSQTHKPRTCKHTQCWGACAVEVVKRHACILKFGCFDSTLVTQGQWSCAHVLLMPSQLSTQSEGVHYRCWLLLQSLCRGADWQHDYAGRMLSSRERLYALLDPSVDPFEMPVQLTSVIVDDPINPASSDRLSVFLLADRVVAETSGC